MKNISVLILLVSLAACLQMSCKKEKNSPITNVNTLAETLRASCTSPFEGHGDSFTVYLPTAFTPNGDGNNDVYRFIGSGVAPGYFPSLSVKIYDTTGTLVFQSDSLTYLSWDGIDRNTHNISNKYKFYVKAKYTTIGNVTDSGSTYLYLLTGSTCVNAVSADSLRYRFPSQFDMSTGYNAGWSSNETYCH